MSRILAKLKVYLYRLFVWGNIGIITLLAKLGKLAFQLRYRALHSPEEKKFALVSHILPPTASGQSIMLERILRDIDPNKYILIATEQTLYNQKNQIPELKGRSITVVDKFPAERFYNITLIYFGISVLKAFVRGWLVAKHVVAEKCTTLLGCSGDPYDLPATYFASVFSGAELVPYYFDDYFTHWGDRQHNRLAGIFEKVLVERARGVIVPNEFLQSKVISRGYKRAQLVRNPAFQGAVPMEVERLEDEHLSDISIVFAGSIYHVNAEAIGILQKATKLLSPYGISCTIDVFSNQTAEQVSHFGIGSENIQFHNHISSDAIFEKMQEADLLLIPFAVNSGVPELVATSAPGKLGDYLASGTPILAVVPENTFVSWYLKEHQCGLVVESFLPLAIAKEIKRFAKNKKLREKIAKNGLEQASKTFDRKLAATKFEEFIFGTRSSQTNIVYITASDQSGDQFNGNLLGKHLDPERFKSYMSVAWASGLLGNVYEYGNGAYRSTRSHMLRKRNQRQGWQALYSNYKISSILPPTLLSEMDIVHLQVIHGAPFFNLEVLPELSRKHKLVITLHDQWLMTGHCTHPLGCDGWLRGCGNCPDLNRDVSMQKDRTAEMYQVKKRILEQTELQLVVASQYMYDKAKESPLLQRFPIELIPFGVDTTHYYQEKGQELRKLWNIPANHKVVSTRTNFPNIYKGTKYLFEALQNVDYKNLTIITFDRAGSLDLLRQKFNIIDLGWVADASLIRKVYSISDLFLAPSIAESFGFMPLEAMSCGAVPVVFQDTVLAETIGWPEYGVAVPYLDSIAYAVEITSLLRNPERVKALSKKGKSLPGNRYPLSKSVKAHEDLYQRLLAE